MSNSTELNYSNQELQSLWQSKEYRNYPIVVLRHFRRNSNLSDGAVLCWQLIHELAYFSEDWSIHTTSSELATLLNKSKATLCRLLNELEAKNYIKKEKRSLGTKISVGLPSDVIKELQDSPDRAARKRCGTIDSKRLDNETPCLKNETKTYINNIYNKNNKPTTESINKKSTSCKNEMSVALSSERTSEVTISCKSNDVIAKQEYDGKGDINLVIANQNNNKCHDNSKELIYLNDLIKEHEEYEIRIYSSLANQSTSNKLELLDKLRNIQAKKASMQNRVFALTHKAKQKKPINTSFGNRKINTYELAEINSAIDRANVTNKYAVTKSIVESVLRGSLSGMSSKTGNFISVQHGLNIALKKLQRKEWNVS